MMTGHMIAAAALGGGSVHHIGQGPVLFHEVEIGGGEVVHLMADKKVPDLFCRKQVCILLESHFNSMIWFKHSHILAKEALLHFFKVCGFALRARQSKDFG